MAQKRVLVIGAILVAAGIGAPTTAFLAPGGTFSEPNRPEVQAPAPPPADEVEAEPEPEAPISAIPTPRRTAAAVLVPGVDATNPPVPIHPAAKPSVSSTAHDGDRDLPPIFSEPPHPEPPVIIEQPDRPDDKPPPLESAVEMDTADQ